MIPVIVPGVYPGDSSGVTPAHPVSKINNAEIKIIGKIVLKLNFIYIASCEKIFTFFWQSGDHGTFYKCFKPMTLRPTLSDSLPFHLYNMLCISFYSI